MNKVDAIRITKETFQMANNIEVKGRENIFLLGNLMSNLESLAKILSSGDEVESEKKDDVDEKE